MTRVNRLRQALVDIIDQCPDPALPYGKAVVGIAVEALKKDNQKYQREEKR